MGNYVWGEFAAMLIISEIGLNTGGTNETIQFFLTNYGAPTEYIDVNFFGDYDDVNGITHSLTGSMHVRRAS